MWSCSKWMMWKCAVHCRRFVKGTNVKKPSNFEGTVSGKGADMAQTYPQHSSTHCVWNGLATLFNPMILLRFFPLAVDLGPRAPWSGLTSLKPSNRSENLWALTPNHGAGTGLIAIFKHPFSWLIIWLEPSSFSRFLFAQTSIGSWCSLLSEIPRPLRASAEVARSEYFHCSAVSTLFAGSRFNEGRGPLDRIARLAWLWRVTMCSDDVPMGGFWIILFFEQENIESSRI